MNFSKAWLAYRRAEHEADYKICSALIVRAKGKVVETAISEYKQAVNEILGLEVEITREEELSCTALPNHVIMEMAEDDELKGDGYRLLFKEQSLFLMASTESGLLYAVFELARQFQKGIDIKTLKMVSNPVMNLRMINHWDNMDGSIERGYSGGSFFFEDYNIIYNERTKAYARLMASIGINAIVINNVNVHERESYLIMDEYLESVKQYSDLFNCYGIKLYLCINFAASIEIGNLPVADPLDKDVIKWWEETTKHVYDVIPELGGYVVKADSEGRPGPFTYGRTQADGANMLGKVLAPYSGLLIWRCFVYNCGQDWRDRKTDRAKAAYDYFMDLDGLFEDNVILQIKNGPMDFQIREPVSPLFGGLKKTNSILEVQIAQEYTGQQKDVCYLIPMWQEILKFNTYALGNDNTVQDIVSGKTLGNINCGIAGVTNVGNDYNWTGNDLAAANLYGFGRLCFSPDMSAEEIAREWVIMTFSGDKKVVDIVTAILMGSRDTYEKYTTPLGIGWMVTPHYHYGPDIEGYEYERWGTYHRADRDGLGVDRTKEGTGYTMQYNEPNASMFENIETCPEELLLFFHYARYDRVLSSGKTLIQHIYDTHFEGVEEVGKMQAAWKSLEGRIPDDAYVRVLKRFEMQMKNAIEWRDRVNTYFYRMSGVKDAKNREIF